VGLLKAAGETKGNGFPMKEMACKTVFGDHDQSDDGK
jgi:hypothetical protein